MFGFDKMFDFNRDGKLDSLERAVQFQFMDDMLKEDHSSSDFDEDEADVFGDAGLDYDELEFMDPTMVFRIVPFKIGKQRKESFRIIYCDC